MLLKRKYLFGTTILAGVMAVSAPAFAQDTQLPGVTARGQEPVTQLEEVISTGSRLRRDPANAPTPLIQVTREELLSTGQSTVIDYLATIPALSNSVVPSDTTGSNLADGGLSLPNLRSLGSGRTLTLIDGRRQVGSSGGSLAVDIDTIPRLLIQNIEIITGGASSVYGADAVSGVLNFVLRRDFEGLEVDANYGMINQAGQANKRISVLGGVNLLDDRLNLWAFGEYDNNDEVLVSDIDWLQDSYLLGGPADSDPALGSINGPATDGIIDNIVYKGIRTISRPRWGQTTIANTRPGVPTRDPEYGTTNCTGAFQTACYGVNPGATWVFEGATARLADFGQRVGFGTLNIGGDGENNATFGQFSRVPDSESQRYAAGLNFDITPNVRFSADVKYVTEDTNDTGQPVFYDFYINDLFAENDLENALNGNSFNLDLSSTAYLPANLRAAIQNNRVVNYTNPTTNLPGQPQNGGASIAAPWARHVIFGPDRTQSNTRELFRATAALEGNMDSLLFVKNFNWSLSYVYGELDTVNTERGTDDQRVNLSSDAVVDTLGIVNGRPNEIVCRAKLVRAQGGVLVDTLRGGLLTDTAQGTAALNECVPLNVFGNGNQSAEALAYIAAEISPEERNEQEQAIAFVSGELFDLWGAGPVGLALGAEYRREFTSSIGRDADTAGRILFLNTGQDLPGAEYESEEVFAELSIPLFRDTWFGRYAELSGSYRYFDYTTAGTGDVYGVNFVYRPIQDIAFKASYNTSFRAPNLGENFSPISQTFANGFVDPCSTAVIQGLRSASDPNLYPQRLANCQAILTRTNAANGTNLAYDFSGLNTPNDPNDDYAPNYTAGIAGSSRGNVGLRPEQSDSLTLSMVIEPRFFPNLSLVLDYYEIEITDVIASLSAANIATNCVSGAVLNEEACALIFRRNPVAAGDTATQRSEGFKVGAPGDPIGGFIEQSFNYAKLQTRGLDFTGRYSLDTEETFGMNLGRFDYSIRGLWLISQKQFLNQQNPSEFAELSSGTNYPRVRFTSSLTWSPNSTWSVNWTADWQTAQDSQSIRGAVNNLDIRPYDTYQTGDFTRHDFSVRYNVSDQLTVRAGVTNAFDAEQPRYLGTALLDNYDPYGTRFNIGLNWRPF